MPNQRHKDKKFVGAWLKGPLYREVKRTAKQHGLTVSEWVTEQLTTAANSDDAVAALADAAMSAEISEVAAKPATGPTSYGSKRKAARHSKARHAPGSTKKAP